LTAFSDFWFSVGFSDGLAAIFGASFFHPQKSVFPGGQPLNREVRTCSCGLPPIQMEKTAPIKNPGIRTLSSGPSPWAG